MLSQNTEKKGYLPETVKSYLGQTERSKQNETCVEAVSALLLSAQEPASFSLRNGQMAMSLKSYGWPGEC